ncbi:MAG: hypothetical protein ACR2JY_13745 [Chloroflexota bacterium]
MGHVIASVRIVWWNPVVALCALLLGRFGLLHRAYGLAFGHNWYALHNGGFCRLRLAPSPSSRYSLSSGHSAYVGRYRMAKEKD